MIRRRILFSALAILIFSIRPSHADDFQTWQWATLPLFDKEDWRLYLYADNRIGDDLSKSYIQILSPRLKWQAHKHLALGLGYAWLNMDPLSNADDFWQHRAEFEFNPTFSTDPWSFQNRNRFELRWNEGRGKRRPRLRNRIQVKYRVGDGFLKHLYANNEFFFDLSNGQYAENRLVPLALGLNFSEHATLNLFYMLQSIDRPAGWEQSHVLGTFLQLHR